jgi:hypothetical protein
MSDFDRSETFRRSIRRPRKLPAPLPPNSSATQDSPEDVSSMIKRLLITKRDFVALPPQKTTNDLALTPTIETDSSHSALMAIQHQINKLEYSAAIKHNEMDFTTMDHQSPIGRRRFPEMESHLNKGLSNLMSADNDETDENEGKNFERGNLVRSSVQGVPGNRTDPKQFKQSRPIARTASDSKQVQVERIRKNIKQKEAIQAELGKKIAQVN